MRAGHSVVCIHTFQSTCSPVTLHPSSLRQFQPLLQFSAYIYIYLYIYSVQGVFFLFYRGEKELYVNKLQLQCTRKGFLLLSLVHLAKQTLIDGCHKSNEPMYKQILWWENVLPTGRGSDNWKITGCSFKSEWGTEFPLSTCHRLIYLEPEGEILWTHRES